MNPGAEDAANAPTPVSAGDSLRSELSPHRDPGLEHQPILMSVHGGNAIVLSCNCMLAWHGTKAVYEPIGDVHDRYDTQKLYNRPWNHRTRFMPKHEIHYKDVEPGYVRPTGEVTVNDRDHRWSNVCWICAEPSDHTGVPHSVATGDGLTRYDIVAFMNQGGYAWRAEA